MLVYPYVNLQSDEPFWISKRDFVEYFDQNDFEHYRHVRNIQIAYLDDWFIRQNGHIYFELPVVSFCGPQTQFINGRHRAAVLLTVQDKLPIALSTNLLNEQQLGLRARIPKTAIMPGQLFELPDLPFIEAK